MTGRERLSAWRFAAVAAGFAFAAAAGERRDIVFDCPCAAEWVAGEDGEPGTLTLTGGIRSLRATASGEIRVSVGVGESESASLGPLPPRGRSQDEWRVALVEAGTDAVVELQLEEAVGAGPDGAARWHRHETLALWPVPNDGAAGRVRFVDILTDGDGDGVGDVNERLAGTSWQDAGSHPGASVVDVLAFYSAEFREAEDGYPHARLLHELTVAGAVFEDSGTDIRLRIVGIVEAELDEHGWVVAERREELMESYGADVSIQAGGPCNCAAVGASNGSRWQDADAAVYGGAGSALVTAHELGHVMGLAHSARQGETYGAYRWSRGHYLTPRGRATDAASAHGFGTVM
ncbi:MAG: hypothetical protein OXG72_10800, partial [Acidobacteria bacterium]|nr:hypothetical protein [Acidobacteriota bacterium]